VDSPRVHPSADVDESAELGPRTRVWHLAQVRENTRLGEDCIVGRGAYVGPGVVVGRWALVAAGVVVTKEAPAFALVAGMAVRRLANSTWRADGGLVIVPRLAAR
jgi:acetyltransferase-like isoleucine patch superfamily enzyme